MRKKNSDVREMIEAAGLKHWQVAETVGVDKATLCVWLRTDLTEERRTKIMDAIERIKQEGLYA